MDVLVIQGGTPLKGIIALAGAKNVALKALVATLLTDEPVALSGIPLIKDVELMAELVSGLGRSVVVSDHTIQIEADGAMAIQVPLELGARLRTSSMVLGPLLARQGEAIIPNPGGCRIGARPIDRHIEGLEKMGAVISYHSDDGYFHAKAKKLKGVTYEFPKNTHTGTETLLLAAVLAEGTTVLKNAAQEVEIDDLIALLSAMGARITRPRAREIIIEGVPRLHGARYTIMPDRNEEVTCAIAAAVTGGAITVTNSQYRTLGAFFDAFKKAGGIAEQKGNEVTYKAEGQIVAVDVVTHPHPGFMTDWQAPWAVLMTQAAGTSRIHETVFESRFSYVSELQKMGAQIAFYDPKVPNPEVFYNYNWSDRVPEHEQAIRITGPTPLHNAVVDITDLRAGATLVLAALAASGESYVHGVEHLDRGYEAFDVRLAALGAKLKRIHEK
jgi:UDP-N-acetylglucosamine 1-carboxyvinyltransferase